MNRPALLAKLFGVDKYTIVERDDIERIGTGLNHNFVAFLVSAPRKWEHFEPQQMWGH